jgi:pyruvate kinase
MRDLILAGADVFRINLSHGTRESHEETIRRARQVSRELKCNVGILLDLRGAKIRTTKSEPNPFRLEAGREVELTGGDGTSTSDRLYITPAIALQNLLPGHKILIDDGKIELSVLERNEPVWRCRIEVGGPVTDRRGVTLMDVPTHQLPGLTDKDRSDIEFGVRIGVDVFALSFVRSAEDVREARKEISKAGGDIPIIAKLEKPEAMEHLDPILEECYGIMVARGDLGVEAPLEKVPLFQKRIISTARRLRKPVITATQMLETMTEKPVPTRAEVSDVANAVFDGTDAVMLSGETSIGKYPVLAVNMMARTVAMAETNLLQNGTARTFTTAETTYADAVSAAACVAAESVDASCIFVYTASGYTASLVSGHRPRMPVYAFSTHEPVVRRLALCWGVEAAHLEKPPESLRQLFRECEEKLVAEGRVKHGDTMAFVAGVPFQEKGNTNLLLIHKVGERTA